MGHLGVVWSHGAPDSRLLLLFPGGPGMVTFISGWTPHGYRYFMVEHGWLLVFPGGLWIVAKHYK